MARPLKERVSARKVERFLTDHFPSLSQTSIQHYAKLIGAEDYQRQSRQTSAKGAKQSNE